VLVNIYAGMRTLTEMKKRRHSGWAPDVGTGDHWMRRHLALGAHGRAGREKAGVSWLKYPSLSSRGIVEGGRARTRGVARVRAAR